MKRLIITASSFALVCLFGPLAFGGLLGVDRDSGILYSVSTVNASLTPVGNTGVASFAEIEFAPNGTLYGFTDSGAPTPSLYKINPSSAAVSLIGPLNLPFVFEGGLAFAPNGSAFGTNADNSGNPELFSLNLATGAATVIATISGGDHDINGLAYRSDGKLIGLDRVSNSLLVIDPATGVSSVLAAVPTTVGGVGGMSVLGGIGYYNTSGPQGSFSGSNQLYSFDLFTGASTLVGSFAPTISGTGISGLAAQVPEPSSVILVACGLLGMAAWGWRRRALAR
jgi:hypothetical protein